MIDIIAPNIGSRSLRMHAPTAAATLYICCTRYASIERINMRASNDRHSELHTRYRYFAAKRHIPAASLPSNLLLTLIGRDDALLTPSGAATPPVCSAAACSHFSTARRKRNGYYQEPKFNLLLKGADC